MSSFRDLSRVVSDEELTLHLDALSNDQGQDRHVLIENTWSKFIEIANSPMFVDLKWNSIEKLKPRSWTLLLRNYAAMFRFFERFQSISSQVFKHHDELKTRMKHINENLFPWLMNDPFFIKQSVNGKGRGIVMGVGNGQAKFAIVGLKHIRWLGCQLPVEIYYMGKNDLDANYIKELESIDGVRLIDILDMIHDQTAKLSGSGWAVKPFALLLSSFEEVILMDADVVFVQNPALLFNEPLYNTHGTLFARDRTLYGSTEKRLWLASFLLKPWSSDLQGTRLWKGISDHEMESGVVVFHKGKRFLAALAVAFINSGKIRDYFYANVHGDKETFWIGAEMVQEPFKFTQSTAGTIGPPPKADKPDEICSPQLLHFDESGEIMWFNQWIFKDRFEETHPEFEELVAYVSSEYQGGEFYLGDNNMCCYTVPNMSDKVRSLDQKQLDILKHLRNSWTEHYIYP